MSGVQPNGPGGWRGTLKKLPAAEIIEMRQELEQLLERPCLRLVADCLTQSHDELVRWMVQGPAMSGKDYAKVAGTVDGLECFDRLIADIRHAADERQKQLAEEAERSRPHEEVQP